MTSWFWLVGCTCREPGAAPEPPSDSATISVESEVTGDSGVNDDTDSDPPDSPPPDTGPPDTSDTGSDEPLHRDDCAVAAAPAGPVPVDPACDGWNPETDVVIAPGDLVVEWRYTTPSGLGVIGAPAIGNLTDDDHDGDVDADDTPDIAVTTFGSDTLVLLDGGTGFYHFIAPGVSGLGGTAIADVDRDGASEILAFSTDDRLIALDADGTTEWASEPLGLPESYPQVTVADLDGDGTVEVIGDTVVVDGATGATRFTLDGVVASWRSPVVADLDHDGRAEIVVGEQVFDADGAPKWANDRRTIGMFSAVLDADGDPDGEVVFVGGAWLDLRDADGAAITTWTLPANNPGPPCVGDLDGDGTSEIVVPTASWLTAWDSAGVERWRLPVDDPSGAAGCSTFDLDDDGDYEVFYADHSAFRVIDGASGAPLFTSTEHNSATAWEYPVIADVDGDGSAEVVVAANVGAYQGVTAFGHRADGWPPSGPAWATHDFAWVNVGFDGSVPTPAPAPWTVYPGFRSRPSYDDGLLGAPDLTVTITDQCVTTCAAGGQLRLAWQVHNEGAAAVPAGQILTLYAVDEDAERPLTRFTLPEVPAGASIDGQTVDVPVTSIGTLGYALRLDLADVCDPADDEARYPEPICD
jgi:hypothetical protein